MAAVSYSWLVRGLLFGGGGGGELSAREVAVVIIYYGPQFPDVCNQENVIAAKHDYR